ncbi:hypothetical protein FRC04_004817 [Tulasnella sp. 424]|nr:hypothetical protein FRC04_004817 [Tulasnella sp. 424]KAG8965147.1 hypothetical protein FRC05_003359 [Tulasnella sp. 425]
MKNNHRIRQNKRAPPDGNSNGPATVYVTETVVVLSPTTTIMLADGQGADSANLERVASMDQKIIIILSTLCFGLVCVVAGLLIWYRRKPSRRKREQWEGEGEIRRMSVRPSPLLVTRSPSSPDDRSSRTLSTNYSGQHLCPRIPQESGARTPDPLLDSAMVTEGRREDGERRPKPTHLTIDSAAIPYRKDERFGLTVPWTAGLSAEANSRNPTRPGRTTRAISYPSDAHLYSPHTPDSSFPLVALSQPPPSNGSIPPSPTHSSSLHHRRLHTVPISISLPTDTNVVKPTGRTTPPTGTPVIESIPGLPPSPPPSPATITSRNAGSRSGSLSTQGQEPNTRPPSSQRRSEFPTSRPLTAASDVRPMTAASDMRPLTSSTHLSLTSSYSADSSTRFSTLFFAPQGSTPPKDGPITEVVGREGDLTEK